MQPRASTEVPEPEKARRAVCRQEAWLRKHSTMDGAKKTPWIQFRKLIVYEVESMEKNSETYS